jgi:hypothetical protein
MSSVEGNQTPDGDDLADAQSTDVQPQMTVHPVGGYSSMPMHMYPFPPGLVPPQPLRSKRRQVKNACTNCQKACKKCDDARPCLRCVKYGIAEECVDSQRKERKKGVKRGPYKKRDGKGVPSSFFLPLYATPRHLSLSSFLSFLTLIEIAQAPASTLSTRQSSKACLSHQACPCPRHPRLCPPT